jgi:ligand-binding SRPBCC domain-containing protein
MPQIEFVCEIRAPLERVWKFHESVDALKLLTPPYIQVTLEGEPEPARLGVRYPLIMKRFGIPIRWLAEYTAFEPPYRFVDRQVAGKGPFKFWEHQHLFAEIPGGTRLTDRIVYEPPFGPLGRLADRLFIRRDLERMFAYRHRVTKERLETETNAPVTEESR